MKVYDFMKNIENLCPDLNDVILIVVKNMGGEEFALDCDSMMMSLSDTNSILCLERSLGRPKTLLKWLEYLQYCDIEEDVKIVNYFPQLIRINKIKFNTKVSITNSGVKIIYINEVDNECEYDKLLDIFAF